MWQKITSILTFLTIISACSNPDKPVKHFLFIGHCYQWGAQNNDRIDKRLESMDYNAYNQIWLGGDLCARTSERIETLHYLDTILGISKPSTHWAIGNHDLVNGSLARIEQVTERPSFYTSCDENICVMVLNTSLNHPQLTSREDYCEEQEAQFEMIRQVADSIKKVSHLIILHHHALLTNELAHHELDMDTLWHYYRPNLPMRCEPHSSFQEEIYPMLVKVQKCGVQVILIGGDVGQRCKSFEYRTTEGIYFLGSGINNSMGREYIPPWVTNLDADKLLRLEYNPEERELRWWFELLEGGSGE